MGLECVSQNYPMEYTAIRGNWRAGERNVEMLGGGREEAGTGAAGRCGAGVWHLVGGRVMAWIGGGSGQWEGKDGISKTRMKTITCPRLVWRPMHDFAHF